MLTKITKNGKIRQIKRKYLNQNEVEQIRIRPKNKRKNTQP